MQPGLRDVRYDPKAEGGRASSLTNPYNQTIGTPYQKPLQDSNEQPTGRKSDKAKSQITWVPDEGWLVFVLLAVALYSVVFSIINAGLVDHSSYLVESPLCGLILGFVIAKIQRFPQAILHLAVVLIGYWSAVWLTSALAYHVSWLLLLQALRSTFSGFDVGANVPSGINFFFYLTFLGFFLGYFGCWLIYRAHLPWLVALVYSAILLVNISYVHTDNTYLVLILVTALGLLIARMHLASQLFQWTREGLHTDRAWINGITRRCMQIACFVTVIVVLFSWLLPSFNQPAYGKELWQSLNNVWSAGVNGNLSWQNLGSLASSSQAGTDFFSNQLLVTGDIHLGNAEVLVYRASDEQSHYLEGVTYNQFDGHNWTGSSSQAHNNKADATLTTVDPYATQMETKVKIIQPPGGTKNYLFAPPQPVSFDTSTVIYNDGITDNAWTQSGALSINEIYQVTSAVQPVNADAYADVAWPGETANALSNNDGNAYPQLQQDLQVPHDLSPDVLKLAKQWTNGAPDAYNGLKMLESQLDNTKEFTYSVSNPAIPANIDAVDWLLKTHQGYCTHYATVMAIMGRLLHIPTRIVGGFSGGQYDQQGQSWVVTNNDAHSWVQAYLPGHGWVNFDPTPGYAFNQAQTTPVAPVTHVTSAASTPVAQAKAAAQATPAQTASSHKGSAKNSTSHSNVSKTNHPQADLSLFWLVGALVLLICALIFLLFTFRRMRRQPVQLAESSLAVGVFWRVCQIASKAGLAPQNWQTPYEYSAMLGQHMPQSQKSLWRLTDMFVRARWGMPAQRSRESMDREAERLWPALHVSLQQLFMHKDKAQR